MSYKSTKDLHHVEIKIRLTDDDADIARMFAKMNDIPLAVACRVLMKRGANVSTSIRREYSELRM